MLTKIIIKNFKKFGNVEIELGNPVVFIGPNNSGKTSALQALALWDAGKNKWTEKRSIGPTPEKRPGVTINRRDLVSAPVPKANLLWRDLHVRDTKKEGGKQITQNIRIDIMVEGVTGGKKWQCGLEFDYANEESFYCRPLRSGQEEDSSRMQIPQEAADIKIAFLPPMSGLAANETRLDAGAINVRVGEGRTAEVLRNLCYTINQSSIENWGKLKFKIKSLFGADLEPPQYIAERGEIDMAYREGNIKLDLSSSGRGLQQTLLLLSYMYANPKSVLLLDEPDAHLEILRQRQIYQVLIDVARETGSQIIAASHSEILLNEAADRDTVIAFVGSHPHRIDDRGSQLLKSLRDIGYEHYYQAEQTGWVLYLEGSTDLAILKAFSGLLDYKEATEILERPFVHYVGNQPSEALKHFYGLREAAPRLMGMAIFDRLDKEIPSDMSIITHQWGKKEIECYLCTRECLLNYAIKEFAANKVGPLFESSQSEKFKDAMSESIEELEEALEKLGKGSPWDGELKVSDDFLTPLFENFFKKINIPNIMSKTNFHVLTKYVPKGQIDPEIEEVLKLIVKIASEASPL